MLDSATGEMARWVDQVQALLRQLAGDWVDEAIAGWASFASLALPRLTLHGAYDAGKSSLLKRFLVENGTPVPDWLRIGAKPTSDTLEQVESAGMSWADSPGTAAGKDTHDALAEEALVLTDALLVVLPPQLLAGDTTYILGLIDGSFHNPFAGRPLFPPNALIVAVAQMDTAGISPDDDLDGYRELGERKRAELTAALAKAGIALPAGAVYIVAADPNQAGLSPHTTPDDYAGQEQWDGIAELRAAIEALPPRHAELRNAAAVRYWSWIGTQAHNRARTELAGLEEVLDAARRQNQATTLQLAELRGIDGAARNRLHEMLRTALLSISLPTSDPDSQRVHLEQQLTSTIDTWLGEWGGKLEAFARTATVDQQARAKRPGAAALRRYLDELLTGLTPRPAATSEGNTLFSRFDEHTKTIARAGFTLLQGMTPDDARAELVRVRLLDTGQLAKYFEGKDAVFTSASRIGEVRRGLRRLEVVEQVLPIVVEFGGLLLQNHAGTRAEQRRIDLKAQIRQQADHIAQQVLDSKDVRAWGDTVSAVQDALETTQRTADLLVTQTEERKQLLEKVIPGLTERLSSPDWP